MQNKEKVKKEANQGLQKRSNHVVEKNEDKNSLNLSQKSEASDPIISFDLMFDAALASKHRRSVRRCKQIGQNFSPSSIHSCTDEQTEDKMLENPLGRMDVAEKTADGDCGERFSVEREAGWNVGKVTVMQFTVHQAFPRFDEM